MHYKLLALLSVSLSWFNKVCIGILPGFGFGFICLSCSIIDENRKPQALHKLTIKYIRNDIITIYNKIIVCISIKVIK